MIRSFEVVSGYDCRNAPCQHEIKGDHGIHGDEWHYIVTSVERDVAFEFTVYTKLYPPTANGRKVPPEGVEGTYAFFHVGFPVLENDLGPIARPRKRCSHVGACWDIDCGALWPRDRFREHGDPSQQVQPESFWQWMEAQLRAKREELLSRRISPEDDRVRCEVWLDESDTVDQAQLVAGVPIADLRRWLRHGVEQVTHRQVISTVTWNGPTEPAVVGDPVDVIALELPGVAAHLNTCSECDAETERLVAFYDVRHVPGWSFRCVSCATKGLLR